MAIRINLGLQGSGKTLMEVRYMDKNPDIMTYSNIRTNLKNQINIKPEMIIESEVVGTKKNKISGKEENIYKFKPNLKYWVNKTKDQPINIVIDEAHSIYNARKQSTA